MTKIKDLTGQKFGRLTVIELDEERNTEYKKQRKYKTYWICQCKCGNVKSVNSSALIRGLTKSCGCLNKELAKERIFKDLTNEKFGRLNVIGIARKNSKGQVYWNCTCECGNNCIVSSYNLTSGKTKSCGCYRIERVREALIKDLSGKRFGRLVVLDLDHILNRKSYWKCKCDCGNETVVLGSNLSKGTTKSCGCLLNDYLNTIKNDLTGKRFGRLTVVKIDKHNSGEKIRYICDCDCGTKSKSIGYTNLMNSDTISCGCYGREMVTGENSHLWKGGITEVSRYFRETIDKWKFDSLKASDFKCCITRSKKNLIVHHIVPFNIILKETFSELLIDMKDTISNYNDAELKLIKDRLLKNHYKYGLGAVITKELHIEFHSQYGQGNYGKDFTKEDWDEFYNNKIKIEK